MDNAEKTFNLPTGYIMPGQEYITSEDDKDKVEIDCTVANPDDYTLDQMEDVVKGWIRHIHKVLRATNTTVKNCQIFRCTLVIHLIIYRNCLMTVQWLNMIRGSDRKKSTKAFLIN